MQGSEHELAFWRDFVKTDRFLNGWVQNIRTPELNDIAYQFFKERPDAYVLDCGSGVVSILRGTVREGRLSSADPLAKEYEKLFDYDAHGLTMPLSKACEALNFANLFDIVHISNAIDHSQQPDLAYSKMMQAVKPGGFLIVQGFVNEGTHEKWQGFHKWNLDIENDKYLRITDKTGLSTTLGSNPYFQTRQSVPHMGKEWIIWIAQKPEA